MKKSTGLLAVIFVATVILFGFASCANDSTLREKSKDNVILKSKLNFDFTDAKALAYVEVEESSNRSITSRAVVSDDYEDLKSGLIKILENGSFAKAVTYSGEGTLSTIRNIYKTESGDVYILFDNVSWFYDTDGTSSSIGQFICIHSDGSLVDILKRNDDADYPDYYYFDNDVKFDKAGNAYFILSTDGMPTICKFDCTTNTITQLTAVSNVYYYSDFIITSDGQLIIVNGGRFGGNTCFIRAIPISDPNHFTNIYYNSGAVCSPDWVYDDINEICYFYVYQNGNSGLKKAVRHGKTFYESEIIYDSSEIIYQNEDHKYVYSWNYTDNYFTNSQGLWKTYLTSNNGENAFYLAHITDAEGNLICEAQKIDLPYGKMVNSQIYGGSIYMSYALLTALGNETGFQQVYKVDLSNGEYLNLFQNVPNNQTLEVESYSVGTGRLYYSAIRGTSVENGVVDIATNEYNPLDVKVKLTTIYTF